MTDKPKLRVLDIETTGFDPVADKVCEVASLRLQGRELVEPFEDLVNPGCPIPPAASGVHHIIDSDVADAPSLPEVLPNHLDATYLVAHNAKFEESFIGQNGKWICTYKIALRLFPDLAKHDNQTLRYHLGLVNPLGIDRGLINAHRALSDCYVTGAIFLEFCKMMKFQVMQAVSKEPCLYTRFTFGKHYGERYDSVEPSYLKWLEEGEHNMDEDIRFTAGYWRNHA